MKKKEKKEKLSSRMHSLNKKPYLFLIKKSTFLSEDNEQAFLTQKTPMHVIIAQKKGFERLSLRE